MSRLVAKGVEPEKRESERRKGNIDPLANQVGTRKLSIILPDGKKERKITMPIFEKRYASSMYVDWLHLYCLVKRIRE